MFMWMTSLSCDKHCSYSIWVCVCLYMDVCVCLKAELICLIFNPLHLKQGQNSRRVCQTSPNRGLWDPMPLWGHERSVLHTQLEDKQKPRMMWGFVCVCVLLCIPSFPQCDFLFISLAQCTGKCVKLEWHVFAKWCIAQAKTCWATDNTN